MLIKNYSKTGQKCRVTFKLPPEINAETAAVMGDFNEWDGKAHPMTKLKDGGFSLSMWLESGKTFRFRYFLDSERWENDWEADGYEQNAYGTDDSVLKT